MEWRARPGPGGAGRRWPFVVVRRRNKALKQPSGPCAELEPVKKLAFEDVTALGVDLQDLDLDLAGKQLDIGANADYQRALDTYEAAKTAADRIDAPRAGAGRHQDPRRRSLRDRLRPGPGRRRAAARRAARRASSTHDTGCRSTDVTYAPIGGARAPGPGLCPGRRAGPGRRRARRTPGHGRHPAGALLGGRPRLPAVRRGLLRRLRPARLDLHGLHVRGHGRRTRWAGGRHRRRHGRPRRRDRRRHRRRRRAASATSSTGSTSDVRRLHGSRGRCSSSCSSPRWSAPSYAGTSIRCRRPAPTGTTSSAAHRPGAGARRHRRARPPRARRSSGKYNICYVNGFQTQAEREAVLAPAPLVAGAQATTAGRRRLGVGRVAARHPHHGQAHALAGIMGRWTDRCADGRLRRRGVRQPRLLQPQPPSARRAGTTARTPPCWSSARTPHGLAAAQKNWAGVGRHVRRVRLRGRRAVRAVPRVRALRRPLRRATCWRSSTARTAFQRACRNVERPDRGRPSRRRPDPARRTPLVLTERAARLHTTAIGDAGSRVVFLHGLFGQGRNWTQIGKALARSRHRVLLVDLPHHGRSRLGGRLRLPAGRRPGRRPPGRRRPGGAGRPLARRQGRDGARAASSRARRAALRGRRVAGGLRPACRSSPGTSPPCGAGPRLVGAAQRRGRGPRRGRARSDGALLPAAEPPPGRRPLALADQPRRARRRPLGDRRLAGGPARRRPAVRRPGAVDRRVPAPTTSPPRTPRPWIAGSPATDW